MTRTDRGGGPGVRLVWLLVGLAASLCACHEQHLDLPGICNVPKPLARLQAQLVSGTIAHPFDAPPGDVWTKSDLDAPLTGPGDCTVVMQTIAAASPILTGRGQELVSEVGTLVVNCGGGTFWSVDVDGIVPRRLALGRYASPPSSAEPAFAPTVAYDADAAGCAQRTPYSISVDVTAATGGVAPFPQMVTPDYQRSFTLHVEPMFDSLVPRPQCADLAPLFDLTFVEDGADVVYLPDGDQGCL